MTTAEAVKSLLERAKNRIADQKHWCQWTYARTKDNVPVDPWSNNATQWCAEGSLHKEILSEAWDEAVYLLNRAAAFHWYSNVGDANDEGRHSVVMTIYDTAIAAITSIASLEEAKQKS